MSAWTIGIFCLSLLWAGIRILIPQGEKSPLYGHLGFLYSLVLITLCLAPLFAFLRKELPELPQTSVQETEYREDALRAILSRNAERMQSAASAAFPEAEFSLRLSAREDGVPTGVTVIAREKETGDQIARFLQKNFELPASFEEEAEE